MAETDTIMSVLLWVLAAVLVIVGLVGVVLPALPGTVLVFAGLWLAAWANEFTRVGSGTLVLLGTIAAASYGIDFVAAALGALQQLRTGGRQGRLASGSPRGPAVSHEGVPVEPLTHLGPPATLRIHRPDCRYQ